MHISMQVHHEQLQDVYRASIDQTLSNTQADFMAGSSE